MIALFFIACLQEDPAELIRRLAEESLEVRDEAERGLRRSGEKARAALAEAAEKHPDPEVRQRARSILAAIDWDHLFPPYAERDGALTLPDLTSKDPKTRLGALRALQKKHPYRLDPLLTRFLDDPAPEVALYAAAHLLGFQRSGSFPDNRYPTNYRPAALGFLRLLGRWDQLGGLRTPFDGGRVARETTATAADLLDRAARVLESLRRSDWPELAKLADHPDPRLRRVVARWAGAFGPEALPALRKLARDRDDIVRGAAESALAYRFKDEIDWKARLSGDRRPADRLRAAERLHAEGDESGLQTLLDLLREPDPTTQREAGRILARFKDPRAREALVPLRDRTVRELPSLPKEETYHALEFLCALADGPSTRAVLDSTRAARPSDEYAWNPSDAACDLVRPHNVKGIFVSAVEGGNEEFARVLVSGTGKVLRQAAIDEAARILKDDRRAPWRVLAGRVLRGQTDNLRWDGAPGEEEAVRERLRPLLRAILADPQDPAFDFAIGAAEPLALSELAPEIVRSLKKVHSTVAMDTLARWDSRQAAPVLREIIEAYRGKEKEATYTYFLDSPVWGPQEDDIVESAIATLAVVGGKGDIPTALRLLRETQSWSARRVLAAFGDESLRGTMRELLAGGKEREVQAGLELAKKLATPAEFPPLRALLETPRHQVEAARLLVQHKDREAVPLLRKVLAGPHAGRFDRASLLIGLKDLGDDAAEKDALRDLTIPDENVQEPALKAVAAFRTREALPVLRRLARTEYGHRVPRPEIVHALAEVGGREALPDLLAAFREDGQRRPYLSAFLRLEAREAVPLIMDLPQLWEAVYAADRLVHADFYRRFRQPFGKARLSPAPAPVAEFVRKTFGVETDLSPKIPPAPSKETELAEGQGLTEFLDRILGRRHFSAPYETVVRDGRLWFCTREEAVEQVRAWWERNKDGFR